MTAEMLLLSLNDENESKTSPTKPDGAPHFFAISWGFQECGLQTRIQAGVVLVAQGCVLSSFEPRSERHFKCLLLPRTQRINVA